MASRPWACLPALIPWTTNSVGSTEVASKNDSGSGIAEFPAWPHFDEEQIEAVARVLRSGRVNYWTGSECMDFEEEFARYIGVPHAISLANGTVALELALRALGIGPGDDVIVPSRTFVATASSVVLAGARPIFADVDRRTQNITAETIGQAMTAETRAVIVVHLAGWPCDMDPILALARERGLKVIEDCAQAHGARYKGRPVGSLGHAAAFSFCQDKIMTTGGEGGMLLTSDEEVWERAWSFKDHGKDRSLMFRQDGGPGFRWVHESIGTNWRMTEVQAAIGRVQLGRLPEWSARRRDNAEALSAMFNGMPALRIEMPDRDSTHAWYKFYLFLRPEALSPEWDRDRILGAIRAEGIPCYSGSCSEVYREQAFQRLGLGPESPFPVARELGETSLMLLVHPTLGREHLERVAEVVIRAISLATQGG